MFRVQGVYGVGCVFGVLGVGVWGSGFWYSGVWVCRIQVLRVWEEI